MELCLGTVQLGMPYGIQGNGKPSRMESFHILDYALDNGIYSFDTAYAYGAAEDLLGDYFTACGVSRSLYTLISKAPPGIFDGLPVDGFYPCLKEFLICSLKRLRTEYLDCYLFHTSQYVFDTTKLEALARLKEDGLVKRVGVSVYKPDEARAGINSPFVDFLQAPCNIFDQRMMKEDIFSLAESQGIQIHIRSALLQGLLAMDVSDISDRLPEARAFVQRYYALCAEYGLSPIEMALAYVKQIPAASHNVFGVDSLTQLTQYCNAFQKKVDPEICRIVAKYFLDVPDSIVIPSLWRK